jgi:biotin transport system substrate-specific component
VLRTAGILAISLAIVFAIGVPWLAFHIGIPSAIQFGFVNVILGGVAKLALAVAVTALGWQVIKPR